MISTVVTETHTTSETNLQRKNAKTDIYIEGRGGVTLFPIYRQMRNLKSSKFFGFFGYPILILFFGKKLFPTLAGILMYGMVRYVWMVPV